MSGYQFTDVNIAMELLTSVVMLILLVSQLANGGQNTRECKCFLFVICMMIGANMTDVFAWWVDMKAGWIFLAIAHVCNFATYLFSMLGCVGFFAYIFVSIGADPAKLRIPIALVVVDSMVFLTIIILTQFNGMVYRIESDNHFYWGEYYIAIYFSVIIYFLLILWVVIASYKKLSKRDFIVYASYPLLPLLASIINMKDINLMMSPVAMALALLIIFVNIQMQREKRLKEQELVLQDQQISIMLSQIQPHFLYNSLASISDLCRNNIKAQQAVITFSNYLRENMNSLTQKEPVHFSHELEHIRQYLWLEKLRFEDKLTVEYDIDTMDFSVPVLSVQPIVENAVQHGITSSKTGGKVCIKTRETEEDYRIIVSDNGVGFCEETQRTGNSADGKSHIGLSNVRKRLKITCNGSLEVDSTPGKGTIVTIIIPKWQQID